MQAPNNMLAEKLNHLIAILDDASEGYLTAAEYARDKELESLFEKLSYQRNEFLMQLKNIVSSIGEETYSKGGFLSLLHRTWKDMCFKLKSRDKGIVKTCCVIGEKFTISYYETILNDPMMPEFVRKTLSTQLSNIHESLHQFQASQTAAISHETTVVSGNPEKKILFLIAYLQEVARDFEMIADEIEDKNLKNTFAALSEEDKQFADELYSQIRLHGFNITAKQMPLYQEYAADNIDDNEMEGAVSKNNELLNICNKSEYLFLKLYTDALKEFLSFKPLTDIMAYQYNSIRAGLLKLRMLNSLRLHQ